MSARPDNRCEGYRPAKASSLSQNSGKLLVVLKKARFGVTSKRQRDLFTVLSEYPLILFASANLVSII